MSLKILKECTSMELLEGIMCQILFFVYNYYKGYFNYQYRNWEIKANCVSPYSIEYR